MATALTAAAYDGPDKIPGNYVNTGGTYLDPIVYPSGGGSAIAFEDQAHPTGDNTSGSGKAYNTSMGILVSEGYLSAIPRSTGGQPYAYYNYGSGTTAGVMFGTSLEQAAPSVTGLSGSCRPFPGAADYNIQADFNGDGVVDVVDLGILSRHYGMPGLPSEGDASGDGMIDVVDMGIFAKAYDSNNFCNRDTSADYCVCVNI